MSGSPAVQATHIWRLLAIAPGRLVSYWVAPQAENLGCLIFTSDARQHIISVLPGTCTQWTGLGYVATDRSGSCAPRSSALHYQ